MVDHQIVNLQFGEDVYVSFTMSAFNRGGRSIRIMGTKGEIEARMAGNEILVRDLATGRVRTHDCHAAGETIVSGHGGGDSGIIRALRDLLHGKRWPSVSDIAESCDNHMIAFAAEQSRLQGGRMIDMDDFLHGIR